MSESAENGVTPAVCHGAGTVPGSSSTRLPVRAGMSMIDPAVIADRLTLERLRSYLQSSGGDLDGA